MSILHSPIAGKHRSMGARMTHFSSWELPVSYSTIIAEHTAVRQSAGLFDISHLGRILVSGNAAADMLSKFVTSTPAALPVGSGRYTLITNDHAGIVDDLFIYRTKAAEFLLVPNASNTGKVLELLQAAARNATEHILVEDKTAGNAVFALQGPRAPEALVAAGGDPSQISSRYGISLQVLGGVEALISRSGYTGEDGFELYLFSGGAELLWDRILGSDEPRVVPCGLGARDTLRLEMGYPLWGQDIDTSTTPLEAGLMFAVDLDSGNFAGVQALRKQKSEGAQRKLSALMLKAGIPRAGCRIFLAGGRGGAGAEGEPVGIVTSGSFSPSLGRGIALGYISLDYASAGTELTVDIRGTRYPAQIVTKPLYKKENK